MNTIQVKAFLCSSSLTQWLHAQLPPHHWSYGWSKACHPRGNRSPRWLSTALEGEASGIAGNRVKEKIVRVRIQILICSNAYSLPVCWKYIWNPNSMASLLLIGGELSDHFLLLSPTMSFVSYPGERGRVNGTGWFLSMLTYGNASSSGNVTVFRVKRGSVHTDSYLFLSMCVFASLWVLCVYVNGHVGLSGVVVTLT